MLSSKLKLIFHWLICITGFYIFWVFSYLILVKFALSQFSRYQHLDIPVWQQITASDVFWYMLFVFGIALGVYVIRQFIKYSPNRRITTVIYAILIVLSVVILVDKLLETTTVFYILPHIFINMAFLIPIVLLFFKKDELQQKVELEDDD